MGELGKVVGVTDSEWDEEKSDWYGQPVEIIRAVRRAAQQANREIRHYETTHPEYDAERHTGWSDTVGALWYEALSR